MKLLNLQFVFWVLLWCAIPGALLYPLALWAAKHTPISEGALVNSYIIGISLLFLPSAFLVDALYGRYFRDHASGGKKKSRISS